MSFHKNLKIIIRELSDNSLRGFEILSGNYKIDNVMEIKTNYSVWIYKLKIHVTKEINKYPMR